MKIWMPAIATGTGAEVYTHMLADGLTAKGHDVVLDIVSHRYQYAPWAAPLNTPSCDVIFANSWNAAAFAGSAPLITVSHHVVHDPALTPYKTIGQRIFHSVMVRRWERAALEKSAAVVAVSDTTNEALSDHLDFQDAITVLNGVDTDFFVPETRTSVDGPIKLLFVGKPSRRKGIDLVSKLVKILGRRAELTVIGPEPERGVTLPPCTSLGRVSREVLRSAYQQADFLLLPSRMEGFGYAAAEAMACGTPVICSDTGAVAEISQIGRSALGISEDSLPELAGTVAGLHHDNERYAAFRSAARANAVENLGLTRWLNEMEQTIVAAASCRIAHEARSPGDV